MSSTTSAVDPDSQAATVVFSGTVGVSTDALATPLTPAQVSTIVNPGKPTVSPSPTPTAGG